MSADLEKTVQEMLGWPFREHGRGPAGIDCMGVALACCAALGRPLPDTEHYQADRPGAEDAARVLEHFHEHVRPLRHGEPPAPGDILAFESGGACHHVGVFLGGMRFAHAVQNAGVVVGRLDRPPNSRRKLRFFRPLEARA